MARLSLICGALIVSSIGRALVSCSDDSPGAGINGSDSGTVGDTPTRPIETAASFDACGGRIFAADGTLDGAEYTKQALAADRATLDCRLGATYNAIHPGANDDRPTAYEPPRQHSSIGRNGAGYDYELGGPPSNDAPWNNTFGSVVDQVLHAPDAADDPGVDRLSTYDWGTRTITEHPEPVWWGVGHPQGRNTDAAFDVTTKDSAKVWTAALGRPLGGAFTAARSSQNWSNDALVVMKPGFIGATGTQTSSDAYPYFMFPPNKVIMSLAVTSHNELTLVAVWDTATHKGQLAVLANLARGLEPVHTWWYFGLPNAGSYTAFKLMGYIDLPFATPTAVSAASNTDQSVKGAQQGHWASLETQAVRDEIRSGPTQIQVATAGYAVVASRWENKVAFVDLQPIFAFLRDRYLTTQPNYDEAKATDPALWPFTFDKFPAIVPTVVKTFDVKAPTAVIAGGRRYGDGTYVHVATYDGALTTYNANTLGSDAVAKSEEIKVIGTVNVGANPTALAWPRNEDPLEKASSPYSFNEVVLVASRAERQISWVVADRVSTKVFRTFRDKRMGDPVDIDVGERAYILTVADFNGKKVINYRFASTPSDHSNNMAYGMGADGQAGVECGGELAVPGKVFKVTSTNVN